MSAVLMPVGATSAATRRPSRPKWHLLYYLLAAFDLCTVVLSLALNHETRGTFARSVADNQVWGQRLADYSELGQLAATVNAPGNDVFDSLNATAEAERMREALRLFNGRQAALREEVHAHVPAVQATRVLEDFDAVAAAMAEMTAEAELIFSYHLQDQPELAGRRMATMDRKYAVVLTELAGLRRDVAAIQQENLAQQEAVAADLAKFEYLIATFVFLMISAATFYGHKLAKRVDADARERERYVEELRDAEARTRSIVDTAADGIVTFDEKGVIESANASAARLFDADSTTLIGQDAARFVPHLAQDTPRADGLNVVSSAENPDGMGVHRETVGRRADATTFPLELAVSEFGLGGTRMFTAIIRDVTERKRAEEERNQLYEQLAEREHRLQELIRRLLLAQEEERRRVAYEVHDGVAQLAAAAQLHLEAFASHVRPRTPEARQELASVQAMVQQTVREVRRVIAGLRPTVLDDFGLAAAIRLEIEALRNEGWQITYDEALCSERLPSEVETALYRVAQEALRNVRKHAGSTRVHVSLRRQTHLVQLEVRDWGRGFGLNGHVGRDRPGEHVGIPGMQERVALLGGRCIVRSKEGAGTRVMVEVNARATSERVA
jgi:PAS domain S-box-containing protein